MGLADKVLMYLPQDERRLEHLIELSQRTHGFIKWFGERTSMDAQRLHHVHTRRSPSAAAVEWIEQHWDSIPTKLRPPIEDREAFGALVFSYFETSFVIEASKQVRATDCGCLCDWCTYMTTRSGLRTRPVNKADRERALQLTMEHALAISYELNVPLDIEKAFADPELVEALALITWLDLLEARTRGVRVGSEVLALWRMFAWTRDQGGPRKGFILNVRSVKRAYQTIKAHLGATPGAAAS